jgi:DNA polymerase
MDLLSLDSSSDQSVRHTGLASVEEWNSSKRAGSIAIDFETTYSSSFNVKQLGSWAYSQDSRFNALLVAVADENRTLVCPPEEFPWKSIDGLEWVSHHRDFDLAVWRRLTADGIIQSRGPRAWHCTAALAAYLQYPRDLASAAKAILNVHLDKTPRSRAKGKTNDPSLLQSLIPYAAKDAEACLAIWTRLERYWPPEERKLCRLTSAMGEHGVAIDWEALDQAQAALRTTIAEATAALPWQPPLSIKEFADACNGRGIKPPSSTAVTSPSFLKWIETTSDDVSRHWVETMQDLRSANRTLKVLEAMQARRKPNGRMAYELKYFGASTGRWSGGGGLNLQNLNRNGSDEVTLRSLIIAPPGHLLGIVDYSQIEARVLLFLAGDHDALQMLQEYPAMDLYEAHARLTMGYTDQEPLKTHCECTGSSMRHLAKARVLGLGFGCGAMKFIAVAKALAGMEISFPESQRIVSSFRESNPKIVNLWRKLQRACEAFVGGTYRLPLPAHQFDSKARRHLYYRDIARHDEELTAVVGGVRVRVYGGLLAENWTQATARDVLSTAWLRCVRAGFKPVLSVHDELLFELPEATAKNDLQRIISLMQEPIPWAPNLPLRADGKLSIKYEK